MLPVEFVAKWDRVRLRERQSSQEHFIDLCRILGLPTPAEADPLGVSFTFEQGLKKESGERGFADVWLKDHFAWEYTNQIKCTLTRIVSRKKGIFETKQLQLMS